MMTTKFIFVFMVLALVGCGNNPSQPSNTQTDQHQRLMGVVKLSDRLTINSFNF